MKEIQLTQGKVAIVDDEDFEFLNQYKWCVSKHSNTYYVVRRITVQSQNKRKNIKHKGKVILIHRLIIARKLKRKLKLNEEIDHINGNGLDNRECNLRIATSQQQNMNQKKQKRKTSSIYKGVYWRKDCKMWHSRIMIDSKYTHLGYFKDEIEAGRVYDKKAKELFGDFACLNFKE